MSTNQETNLHKEIEELNTDNQYYFYQQSDTNTFPIILEIRGPINTPYEGGVFSIEIKSNEVKFITKICSIFVNINNGEILDKDIMNLYDQCNINKANLINILNFIKDKILISPNSTEYIEELKNWIGKDTYFEYLKKIKSCTQKYANIDGIKIKIDKILLTNENFSKYENKNQKPLGIKSLKRLRNEFNFLSYEKLVELNNGDIYICPFNNFNQFYFEILGQPGTPYEGGVFQFLIELSHKYPFEYGKCIFRTKIFHNKFHESNWSLCDSDFIHTWSPTKKIYDIIFYFIKIMNKYDYPCKENVKARKMIKSNFKEFLQNSKLFTKSYANLDGMKLIPNLNLIEKSSEELNIEPPKEKDFMPKIEKEFDKNIKEEDIEIIATQMITKKSFKLNMKTTDFIIDSAIKIREYYIKIDNALSEYKNLLPKIIKINQNLDLNKQIGVSGINNGDSIYYYFNFPTCSDY